MEILLRIAIKSNWLNSMSKTFNSTYIYVTVEFHTQIRVLTISWGRRMNEAVKTIHQVNIRPLWLSLFEQTSAELSSALYVHRAANSNVSIETLRAAMNILSLKLGTESVVDNERTLYS
jgi:ABC-type cobalt transport system substrate-binding protein